MIRAGLFLALDFGTTTLAGRVLDGSGNVLVEARHLNPQRVHGSDIIRRLEAARLGDGLHLRSLLAEGVQELIGELLSKSERSSDDIVAAAAAGNPGICHLLRRLPVDRILFPPHRPAETQGVSLAADDPDLGLPVPLYLFPLVSGYVGGDLVAFLFGMGESAADGRSSTRLYIDIGTNGELALCAGGRWWVTSVAAGPAFEGGGIACGMAVGPGAVERVRVEGDSLHLSLIGAGPPLGLCGSGLVSAVAVALEAGLVDSRGTIVESGAIATNLSRYVVEGPEGRRVRLHRDAEREIFLSQQDLRNFQLAKGALRAGVDCLLRRAGIAPGQVEEVVMTGAFGFSLDPETLKRVALLPPDMVDKVRFVPAGALAGVGRLLTEPGAREKVETFAGRLEPFPLSGTPAFEKAFLDAIDF